LPGRLGENQIVLSSVGEFAGLLETADHHEKNKNL
jgi:hypothetical protein